MCTSEAHLGFSGQRNVLPSSPELSEKRYDDDEDLWPNFDQEDVGDIIKNKQKLTQGVFPWGLCFH